MHQKARLYRLSKMSSTPGQLYIPMAQQPTEASRKKATCINEASCADQKSQLTFRCQVFTGWPRSFSDGCLERIRVQFNRTNLTIILMNLCFDSTGVNHCREVCFFTG